MVRCRDTKEYRRPAGRAHDRICIHVLVVTNNQKHVHLLYPSLILYHRYLGVVFSGIQKPVLPVVVQPCMSCRLPQDAALDSIQRRKWFSRIDIAVIDRVRNC